MVLTISPIPCNPQLKRVVWSKYLEHEGFQLQLYLSRKTVPSPLVSWGTLYPLSPSTPSYTSSSMPLVVIFLPLHVSFLLQLVLFLFPKTRQSRFIG